MSCSIILLDTTDNRKEFPIMNFHGYASGKILIKINCILFGKIGIPIEIESNFLYHFNSIKEQLFKFE